MRARAHQRGTMVTRSSCLIRIGKSDQRLPLFSSERPSHPPFRTSQSLLWTLRRKRALSNRSCLLTRITPLGYLTVWAFRNHLRENRSTLRSRRGFCFRNKSFPTIGYPSIKCECADSFSFGSGVFGSRYLVRREHLIDWGHHYYQTSAERTFDPFIDQA